MAGGRLIFDRRVELALLDTVATTYDSNLREPRLERASPDDRVGRKARRERIVCTVAQIQPKLIESLRSGLTGNIPQSDQWLIFHWDNLMEDGLIGPDGDQGIKVGARLLQIMTVDTWRTIVKVEEPGLFAIESKRDGFGFGDDAEWNLLKVRFQDREHSSDR